MKSLFFVGLMLFVSLFVAACSGQSEEVVGNGKDKDTVAVVADSQIVSLPCPWKGQLMLMPIVWLLGNLFKGLKASLL